MKTNREIILNILQDHIITQRLFVKVSEMLNVFNPNNVQDNDLEAEIKYRGYTIALQLLEVNIDLDLDDKLCELFWDLFDKNPEENAAILSQLIYVGWLEIIRIHYLSISNTAA